MASGCLGYEVRTRNTKREREEVRGKQGQNDVDGIDERNRERAREREVERESFQGNSGRELSKKGEKKREIG